MNCFSLAMQNPEGTIQALNPLSLLLLAAVLYCQPLSAAPLTASETRGKQLYLTGGSPSGKPVQALVGPESAKLAGADVPCAGCHGEDGESRPEGGIVPPDITFEHLTLPYGHNHDNGRKHPAFTADTLITAITVGIDPAGNRLDAAMPRYTLSASDSADLIAYLKRLSSDVDPGLTDTTIDLGTVLPTRGPLAAIGLAMKAMLTAYFAETNAQGGIYHRKIRLKVAEFTGDADSTTRNVQRLLKADPVFALIAPFAANLERDILLLTESRGVPQIGPYTLFPEDDTLRSRAAFYLLPGLNSESIAMVDYASDVLQLNNTAAMVISPENAPIQKAVDAIEQRSRIRSLGRVTRYAYPSSQFQPQAITAEFEKQPSPEVIFFFGSDLDLRRLLQHVERLAPKPYLFVSGALTGSNVFNEAFRDRIFLSFPAQPREPTQADEFFRLIKRHKLATHHLTAQAVAYSAARLLMEGLQKTGRALSRKKLITALEQIDRFDTGLLSPLSYGPNRHIGSREVRIIPASPGR